MHGRRSTLHHLRLLPGQLLYMSLSFYTFYTFTLPQIPNLIYNITGQLLRAPPLLPLLPSLHRPSPSQLPHHHRRPPHCQLPPRSLHSEQVDNGLLTVILKWIKDYHGLPVTFARIPVEGDFAGQKISKPAEVKITF